jgi:hypothetical protein
MLNECRGRRKTRKVRNRHHNENETEVEVESKKPGRRQRHTYMRRCSRWCFYRVDGLMDFALFGRPSYLNDIFRSFRSFGRRSRQLTCSNPVGSGRCYNYWLSGNNAVITDIRSARTYISKKDYIRIPQIHTHIKRRYCASRAQGQPAAPGA